MIIKLTSFDAPELDVFARLSENQLLNRHEPEKGLFIAESPKVIERALNSGCVPVTGLVEENEIHGEAEAIINRLNEYQIPIYTAPYEILKNLTGFPMTRGMLCAMRRPMLPSIEEVCRNAKRVVLLENVMNPTNVGAIFRSAAALSMDAVLLTGDCSNPLYRRAIRVSMGTVFQIPWTFLPENISWPREGMKKLKDMGFKIASMALEDRSVDIDDQALCSEPKLILMMGSEGDGLLKESIQDSDYVVKIPMSHGVDSLNVAAASSVAFWQLNRFRKNLI